MVVPSGSPGVAATGEVDPDLVAELPSTGSNTCAAGGIAAGIVVALPLPTLPEPVPPVVEPLPLRATWPQRRHRRRPDPDPDPDPGPDPDPALTLALTLTLTLTLTLP